MNARRSIALFVIGSLCAALALAVPATALAAPAATAAVSAASEDTTVTLLAAGDLMCHISQLKAGKLRRGYDFWPAFQPVASVVASADVAFANFETTLRGSGFRGYPGFRSPTAYADAVKAAGFDLVSTANNHALDGGAKGVGYTIAYLDSIGVRHFGTGDPAPLIVESNGIRFAFLSYTYATNGIRSPRGVNVNRLKLDRVAGDIAAVRGLVDVVVVVPHWGAEYKTKPESSTRRLGRAIIDAGADIVLGSHPHVPRPIEVYNGRYIVYSMGNFISGMSRTNTDLGIIVKANVVRRAGVTTVQDLKVLPVFRDKTSGKGRASYRVVMLDQQLAAPDKLISKSDRSKMRKYRSWCAKTYGSLYTW